MTARKRVAFRAVTAGMLLLALSSREASGDDGVRAGEGRGTYIGIFGGVGVTTVDSISNRVTTLGPESSGGPSAVNASGSGRSQGMGIGGLTIGHEWSGRSLGGGEEGWTLLPAAELEGFYMGGTLRANLNNPTNRVPSNTFAATFPINSGVFLTNAVLTFHKPDAILSPYVGVGIGAAYLSSNGANLTQLTPPEPGLNHFNTDPNASVWGFAAQLKAGVRIPLGERCHLFAEYRYLHVDSTTRNYGDTQSPGHVPTTPWRVDFGAMGSHLGVCGVGFRF